MNYNNKMNYKFAIVDQNDVKNINKELYDYVLQKTLECTKKLSYDVKVYDTIDEAVSDSTGVVVIQSVGNFINSNNFTDLLEDYIQNNPNFFALAFTLDWMPEKGEGWIELHSQMMVINTKVWRDLGCPSYGYWTREIKKVPKYTRSEENFHDKYTPYWIKGAEGEEVRTVIHPGWGFLQAALSNGIKIDNFSEEMRKCRLYIYPEFESNQLYTSIINKDDSLITNFNQKQYLRELE